MSAAVAEKNPPKVKKVEPHARILRDLEVFTWNATTDPEKDRQYVSFTTTFGDVERWIYTDEFSVKNTAGWQREEIKAHVRYLRAEMEAGNFTPTAVGLSIEDHHTEDVKLATGPDGKTLATVKITEEKPLAVIDGNHRFQALRMLLARWRETEAKEDVLRIINLPVTILLGLTPKFIQQDFLNYQKGRAVSTNLTKTMEILADITVAPPVRLAVEASRILSERPKSHLFQRVSFEKNVAGMLQIATLSSANSSALATNMSGGALIALAHKKKSEWLAKKQIEAYQAILQFADKTDPDDPDSMPRILDDGYPLSAFNKGKGVRGGPHMLIAIGNMYAWRMAQRPKQEPEPGDLEWIAEVAQRVFDVNPATTPRDRRFLGSAEDKRIWLRKFNEIYFEDMDIRYEGFEEIPIEKVGGVPVELIELLSASTLGVSEEWKEYKKSRPKG